jgi:hypothetical protein
MPIYTRGLRATCSLLIVLEPAAFQWMMRLQTNWNNVWDAYTQNNG